MSIKYSLTGPDATAKQIRDLKKTQRENSISAGGGSDDIGQYLPGGSGFAHTDSAWVPTYYATTSGKSRIVAYDKTYDKDVSVTVSKSGVVLVTITAWLSVTINVPNWVSSNIGVRAGIMPITWYDNETIPTLADGQYGGCQITHDVYANEHFISTVGMTSSNIIIFSGLTPGRKLNIRSRRFYWGWYGTPTSTSSLPSGGYYTINISSMTMQATPTYAGNI